MKIGNPESNSKNTKLMEGVYLREYKILSVEDLSNYPNHETKSPFQSGFMPELCLKLTIQSDDMDNPVTRYLFGNFRKNNNKQIIGWNGFNNQVQFLLYHVLGEFEISDNFEIYPKTLTNLIGKKIKSISFVSKYDEITQRLNYENYGKLFPSHFSNEKILEIFNKDLPYLKKYHPEAIEQYEEAQTKFNPDDLSQIDETPTF